MSYITNKGKLSVAYWIIFYIGLIALFLIDIRTYTLPQWMTYPLLILGVVRAVGHPDSVLYILSGAGTFLIFWIIRILSHKAYGTEALGFGDVMLVSIFGLWGTFHGAWISIVMGLSLAMVWSLVSILLSGSKLTDVIPLGPFLISGWILNALWLQSN